MKKVAYLMTILFTVALMSTSCCKDDDPTPDVITTSQLEGDWYFQSLNYNGTLYDTESELLTLTRPVSEGGLNKAYGSIDFFDVSASSMKMTFHSLYNAGGEVNLLNTPFTYSNNIIIVDEVLEYEIQDVQGFISNPTILKIKLTEGGTNNPIGGVYTLTK